MGRTATKVEKVEAQIAALYEADLDAGRASVPSLSLAKDVEVTRLSLPSAPPLFDPCPLLDKPLRELYLHPSRFTFPLEEAPMPPPKVVFRASSKAARLDFLAALDRSGRLRLLNASEHDRRTSCGLFTVPKSLDADRLIVDARPANLCMGGDGRWLSLLACAECLLNIELQPHEQLLCSGEDVRDYYHQFTVSNDRAALYRFEGVWQPADLSHLPSFRSEMWGWSGISVALGTMAMGDKNSVSLGQACHAGIVLDRLGLSTEHFLCIRGRVPRSPLMVGVLIDDLVILERALRGEAFDVNQCRSPVLIKRLREAYSELKLPRHEKKAFYCAREASFWGADVLGELGLVRPSWSRLVPLVVLSLAVVELPAVSVSLLEVLAGSWVAAFAFRRRALCLLEEVYRLQRGRSRSDLLVPPVSFRAEVFRWCVLAPLVRADLRASSSGLLVCSDASDDLGAFVSAVVSPTLARELQRHVPVKGLWSKLLAPVDALLRQKNLLDPELELPGETYSTHPLWTAIARSLKFRLRAVFRRRKREHINLKEMDSYVAAEEALATNAWESRRTVGLLDSQVCVGALLKGRSASFSLNSRLRSSLPGVLFFNLHPHYAYIASGDNPADDPTRMRPVRAPCFAEPLWLREAESGNFRLLDTFLKSLGLHPLQLQGLWDLEESFADRDRSAGFPELASDSPPRLNPSAPLGFSPEPFGFKSRSPLSRKPRLSRQFSSTGVLQIPQQVAAASVLVACRTTPLEECAGDRSGLPEPLLWVARRRQGSNQGWALTFDWVHGPGQVLREPTLQARLLSLIESGAFLGCGIGFSCPSLSSAVQPPWRNEDHPEGLPNLPPHALAKVTSGNLHVAFVVSLVKVLVGSGVPFWFAGAETSWIWKQPACRTLVDETAKAGFWTVDFCRYGCKWKKRTRFFTNCELAGTSELCLGGHVHQVLRGRSAEHQASWTKVASKYPRPLCDRLATSLYKACRCSPGGISACVRDPSPCVGQASNPGPPKRQLPRSGSLFDVELVDARTIALRTRVWDAFVGWLRERLSHEAVLGVFSCPTILAMVLRTYSDELYKAGASLGSYRQLLAHAQKVVPLVRPFLKPAWEMATRWEELQPVSHRTPCPEVIVRAMVGLALAFGWRRWAGVTLAIFYCIARPGELLTAKRSQILTPLDILDSEHPWLYVRILRPKSRRKAARVQHAKLKDSEALLLLTALWQKLRKTELLYPGSPSIYRRRWDRLLALLQVPKELKLTPGSLRSGGAVSAFQKGESVSELLWRMRLRSLATLEFYLQETAAISVLPDLPEHTRRRLLAAASIYRNVVAELRGKSERASRP